MAKILGSVAVGSTVKFKVSGTLREFLVVHQGRPSTLYDSSCDGTWLLMKDIYVEHKWNGSNVNNYVASDVHAYLNSTFLSLLDINIQTKIKQIKLPYCSSDGTINSGINGLSCKVFLLSEIEICGDISSDYLPHDGAKLDYFHQGNDTSDRENRIAYLNGTATYWWSRSPFINSDSGSTSAWLCHTDGGCYGAFRCTQSRGVRPALILPPSLLVSEDYSVQSNTAPTTPTSITVPSNINGDETITLSWPSSTDAEGNLEGYKVERSTDGGSTWAQIYQGTATTTTNMVAFGTASVMYRVRAYDTEGLHSGWRTSQSVTVVNNLAPTAPGSISIPLTVNGGKPLTVSWTAATDPDGNLSGYALERQDNGGEWAEIYRGDALTYTDSVPKGLQMVAYRVRAYDDLNACGPYAATETRTVNNNTAPMISCSAGDLGEQSEGFTVPYSVSDEDGDDITVTEAVDGKTLRTFQAEDGGENTLSLTGETFMQVLNGTHSLTITASDGKEQSVYKLAFSKSVTEASVTLAEPLPADAPITVCALSVSGSIPADAEYKVEVTNNALDAVPVWEDCTAAVRSGANIVFAHQAESGHGFNFRLQVSRGPSGQGGYITSIQGGFQ